MRTTILSSAPLLIGFIFDNIVVAQDHKAKMRQRQIADETQIEPHLLMTIVLHL